jgi:SAM-dependent methyltransferase
MLARHDHRARRAAVTERYSEDVAKLIGKLHACLSFDKLRMTERSAGRRFDHDYGVTTQALLFLDDLDPDAVGDAGAHATHYEAVPVDDFREMMSDVPADVIAASTFVDIGSGMGRAILLASEYPFKQIVGVELSPSLHEVAKDNLARATAAFERRCHDIRLVRDDARIFEYPPGDVVAFLYNPFDAIALEATLGALLARRQCGETWLLYHTPLDDIEADPAWEVKRFRERRGLSASRYLTAHRRRQNP